MPFALLLVGAMLAVTAYRGTTDELFDLVKKDFTGTDNFGLWLVAIFGVGLIGYIPRMEAASRLIFVLIFVTLFISKKGVFAQFADALRTSSASAEEPKKDADFVQWSAGGGSDSKGGGFGVDDVIKYAPIFF